VKKKVKAKATASKVTAEHRRALFIDAYLANGGNGKAAAIEAGFSPKTAEQQASRLLRHVKVKVAVEKRHAEVEQKSGLSVERTLREVARLAYADPRKLFDADGQLIKVHLLDDDTAACIASIEVDEIDVGETVIGHTKKIKQWDKNSALEKAMKFHGLYEKDNDQMANAVARIFKIPAKQRGGA